MVYVPSALMVSGVMIRVVAPVTFSSLLLSLMPAMVWSIDTHTLLAASPFRASSKVA